MNKRTSRKQKPSSTPLLLVTAAQLKPWLAEQPAELREWVAARQFKAEPGSQLPLPAFGEAPARILIGVPERLTLWSLAHLPYELPPGDYRLETHINTGDANAVYLGWQLGCYRFTRYKKPGTPPATLLPPPGCDAREQDMIADAITMARDLINTPANHMGPEELAEACKALARTHRADYSEIIGEDLPKQNYPAIYEVGKASTRAPRLIDIRHGNPRHPKVTLVGKGVCFDTGGLDIKPSSGMKLMKKDMGGAACVMALATIIMESKLKVRLRVLIPAVENSIAGNAYRPSDVISTRKGLQVEIGNTDAEGRLILCDALAEADSEQPDLLIDCATLTGAARTALGPEVPALFTPSDTLAESLYRHASAEQDPLWRLPLWAPYREMLNTPCADINSAPDGGYAGAITAAIYLHEFVTETTDWAHLDMMAWNIARRPGRPVGGEAMAVRALYAYLRDRFGKS